MRFQERSKRSVEKKGHPWRELEGDLQELQTLKRERVARDSMRWERPIDAVNRALLATASRILLSPGLRHLRCEVEPAVQQWWVQFFSLREERFRPDAPLFPYAYVMLARICQTMARRARIRQTKPLPGSLGTKTPNPRELAEKRERNAMIRAAVEALSPDERELVRETFWQDVPAAERARKRGVSMATTSRRRKRALRQLLESLPDELHLQSK